MPWASGPMLTNKASFDGRRLLLAGWDAPTAALWDVETGLRIREFVGHAEGVRSVAVSPDGRFVLTGAGNTTIVRPSKDGSVRLWDFDAGRELRRFEGATDSVWVDPILEVGFSRTGAEVLGLGRGLGLTVWRSDTGEVIFQQPSGSARDDVQQALRGRFAMTRTYGSGVRVWDYLTGDLLAEIDVPRPISSNRWSPDGSLAVIASGLEVSVWASATGRLVRTFTGHTGEVSDAMFSADGQRIISAAADGSARLWDRDSGEVLGQLRHEGAVQRALLSPDNSRALTEWTLGAYPAGQPGPYVSLWDLDSARELVRFDQTRQPLGFSPDGRTIPVVSGGSFRTRCCRLDSLVDAETGRLIREFGR